MTRPVEESLPPNLAPRGLARHEAAAYIGIGSTVFDRLVRDGRMPKPKVIDGKAVWDRRAIDIAFEDLPEKDQDAGKWKNPRA